VTGGRKQGRSWAENGRRATGEERRTNVSRSRWPARPKTWVDGRSIAGIAGSNPAGAWMSASCVCYVLPGRGLRDGSITCPECVCVCHLV
jgi:hypothetical protein